MNILLFLLILTISCGQLFSQTRIRTQSYLPDYPPYTVFHTEVPILQNLPPLQLSMPYNVMLSYVALDSFGRFEDTTLSTEDWLNRMTPDNDTLHTLWKYAYELMDYDPIRLYQYLEEQYMNQNIYKNHLRFNFYNMIGMMKKLNHPKKEQLFAALNSMYILKVRVLEIDSMKSSFLQLGDSTQYNHFKITCTILDTIKGKVIPMELVNNNNNFQKGIQQNINFYSTFSFITTSKSSPQFGYASHFYPKFPKVDTLIFDFSRMIMRLQPGQDAIIFLHPFDHHPTKTHDYLRLVVAYSYSNAILPIVGGMVSDVNKIWSDSTWIQYSTWKEKYNEAVEIIMNKGY